MKEKWEMESNHLSHFICSSERALKCHWWEPSTCVFLRERAKNSLPFSLLLRNENTIMGKPDLGSERWAAARCWEWKSQMISERARNDWLFFPRTNVVWTCGRRDFTFLSSKFAFFFSLWRRAATCHKCIKNAANSCETFSLSRLCCCLLSMENSVFTLTQQVVAFLFDLWLPAVECTAKLVLDTAVRWVGGVAECNVVERWFAWTCWRGKLKKFLWVNCVIGEKCNRSMGKNLKLNFFFIHFATITFSKIVLSVFIWVISDLFACARKKIPNDRSASSVCKRRDKFQKWIRNLFYLLDVVNSRDATTNLMSICVIGLKFFSFYISSISVCMRWHRLAKVKGWELRWRIWRQDNMQRIFCAQEELKKGNEGSELKANVKIVTFKIQDSKLFNWNNGFFSAPIPIFTID